MQYELTEASQRAVEEATHWSCGRQDGNIDTFDVTLPALLLGLLSQSECRAAIMLADSGIDAETIRRRWPGLSPAESPPDRLDWTLSPQLLRLFHAAEVRMRDLGRSLELATEHLLLGIAALDEEVSQWLAEYGLDVEALEARIHTNYGHTPTAIPPARPGVGTSGMRSAGQSSQARGASRLAERLNEAVARVPVQREGHIPSCASDSDASPPEGRNASVTDSAEWRDVSLLRILDAASNRAGEALRVVEDYVRFALDDLHLTGICKRLRHELAAALPDRALQDKLTCRNTRSDVGTCLTSDRERDRADLTSVLSANFRRLQESLRSLEEYGKIVSPDFAARIERIRYESYTLERATESTRRSLQRLGAATLYVLIDGCAATQEFEQLVHALVEARVSVIQLRDKGLSDRALLDRARQLRGITASTSTLFVMNDRADLAIAARADGVHVGQHELSVKDTRRLVGTDMLIGVSTHSLQQAREAVLDGADYIGIGPVFPSTTKQFDEFVGVEAVAAVAREIRLPAFAIGGIDRNNLGDVLGTGIGRVAVSGAIVNADDPGAAAREMLRELAEGQPRAGIVNGDEKVETFDQR